MMLRKTIGNQRQSRASTKSDRPSDPVSLNYCHPPTVMDGLVSAMGGKQTLPPKASAMAVLSSPYFSPETRQLSCHKPSHEKAEQEGHQRHESGEATKRYENFGS